MDGASGPRVTVPLDDVKTMPLGQENIIRDFYAQLRGLVDKYGIYVAEFQQDGHTQVAKDILELKQIVGRL